jgi:hypothetical protein
MPFFDDLILTESVEIKTTPAEIFTYLIGIVDDESFKKRKKKWAFEMLLGTR